MQIFNSGPPWMLYPWSTIFFRFMRSPAVCLFIAFMLATATVYGQDRITIKANRMPVQKLFKQLQKKHGYSFFYKIDKNNDLPSVTIDVRNATIEDILQQCFKGTAFDYMVVDKTVVIRRKAVATPMTHNQLPPSSYITGIVTDKNQVPLPGVTIRLKGSDLQWTTNSAGRFNIVINESRPVLQLSYIGFQNKEVVVSDVKNLLSIEMEGDISKLDEVQVIAYGTTSKRNNTGNITTIDSKEIARYPVTNVLEVLQGAVPGMEISRTSGNPGSGFSVLIRGRNGGENGTGSEPLYIIDGIPFQGGGFALQNQTLVGGNALNLINPLDIASVSVLKDADATSIYGSRAANGVVIITTKKGKAGKTNISVNANSGISRVSKLPDLLSISDYLQMRREAKRNDKIPVTAIDYDINGTWDTVRKNNLVDEVLGGTAYTNNVQASMSGGTDDIQYLVSGNFNNQTNIFRQLGGDNRKVNLHFNINAATANKKFYVQFTGDYLYNINTIPQKDITSRISLAPNIPAFYNPDGSFNFANNTFANPLVNRNLINNSPSTNISSSMTLGYRPSPKLEFKAAFGYNKQQINEFLAEPRSSFQPTETSTPVSQYTYNNNSSWSVEPQVNYLDKIGMGNLNVTFGGSLQHQMTESTQFTVTGFANDALIESISAGTSIRTTIPYSKSPYKFIAGFGRITYNLAEKYILNVSGRYDGSSKFGVNKQFHFFGAAGAAWIFSEESFFKRLLPIINFGKLRASYGVTGNDQIGPYGYLETYGSLTNPYQGLPGLVPFNLANPNLSWETTKKMEAALEIQVLKGAIFLEAAVYRHRTTDILGVYPLSTVTGFPGLRLNQPSKVQNLGVELSLTTNNIRKENFSWSSTMLFTRHRNKLLEFPSLASSSLSNKLIIGQPIGVLTLYKSAGVNPETGIYQFYDLNGQIVSSPSPSTDRTVLINTNPDFFGSVNNSFRYKQFTLDFLVRYIKKIGKNELGQQSAAPAGAGIGNFTTRVLRRWQKPGDMTDVQRYGLSVPLLFGGLNAIESDLAYSDASYIRFQNLSFGYNFNGAALNKLRLQNLRIYIQAENLLTISKYDSLDPESLNVSRLPMLRTITTGLQVTF
jgi:TonB-linked SusC/RagA family outer membrane protein